MFPTTMLAGTVGKTVTMIMNVSTSNIKGVVLKGIFRVVPREVLQDTLREALMKIFRETLKGAPPILLT